MLDHNYNAKFVALKRNVKGYFSSTFFNLFFENRKGDQDITNTMKYGIFIIICRYKILKKYYTNLKSIQCCNNETINWRAEISNYFETVTFCLMTHVQLEISPYLSGQLFNIRFLYSVVGPIGTETISVCFNTDCITQWAHSKCLLHELLEQSLIH